MSEWNDTEMVETLAKAVMERIDATRRPMYVPATVVGADTTVDVDGLPLTAVPYFSVHVDTDPPDVTIQAAAFARWPFAPGDRVMVAWDWPHAAYIVYPLQGIPEDRPYATVLVAADNSYAIGHLAADFVCDGVNDDETIADALALTVGNGGKVLLLEGDYNLSATVVIADATLAGLGRNITRLSCSGAAAAFEFANGTLEDMSVHIIDGYGWELVGTAVGAVRRVDFTTQGGA
jgi:hypothetical protein